MVRRHSSFLVRCWDIGSDDEERIEIEHVQSGAKALVRSIAEAAEWISARRGDAPANPDELESIDMGTGKGGIGR